MTDFETDFEKRVQTICDDLKKVYQDLLNVLPKTKRLFTDNLCQLITMYDAIDKNIDHIVVRGTQVYPGDIDYNNDKEELNIFLDDNTLPNIFLNTNKSFTIPDDKLIFTREEIEQELKLYEEEVHHDGKTGKIR